MPDPAAAVQLFDRLLADPAVVELAPIRECVGVEVRSVTVNGDRVDVVAVAADHEWRVVFGTDDMATAQWVSVFARPEPFQGVIGGRVVVVNGQSSAGKSTLLRALSTTSPDPWVVFDEPMFGSVRSEYLIWPDTAPTLHDGFAALAAAGNFVALAAGGRRSADVRRAFAGAPVSWIGLDCSDDERQRREATRRDVPGGHFAASPDIHDGWVYDLRFDSSVVPLDEMVRRVLEQLG